MKYPLACQFTALLLATASPLLAGPDAIPLWPHDAPGEKSRLPPEADTTKTADGLVAGKQVIRLGNVSNPTITVFAPPADRATGAAVLVCPGGGYHILAMDLEGTEVCEWLNSLGITAVLLKYRVPKRAGQERHLAPLQDAQRAMSLVRQRAVEWGLDPRRLGCIGFSAGGHLCAALATGSDRRSYEAIDEADKQSSRPDFAMLIYPGYLTIKEQGDIVAPELNISAETPPTFLAQSQDDSVRVETSLFYYLGLKNAKVPAELHLYPSGGHGYGLRPSKNLVTTWPQRAADWLGSLGVLERKK